nr:unnamed protein product [Spirometra erinaceieuropaei]
MSISIHHLTRHGGLRSVCNSNRAQNFGLGPDLAMETVELLLRSKYNETGNRLGHAQILQLLNFCLRTFFTSDGTIYEQVNGTPMDSPISEASFRRVSHLRPLAPPVFSSWSRHRDQAEEEESLWWILPMSAITIN